ncbi:MAG: hypothetical protein AB1637_00350 [Elusimicrobiota bacterium]
MKKIIFFCLSVIIFLSGKNSYCFEITANKDAVSLPVPQADIKCDTLYCHINMLTGDKYKTEEIISNLFIKDSNVLDCDGFLSSYKNIKLKLNKFEISSCGKKIKDFKEYFYNEISYPSFLRSIQISYDGRVLGLLSLSYVYGLNTNNIDSENFVNLIFHKKTKALCLPWDDNGCRFTTCRIDSSGEKCINSEKDAYCGPTCGK